MTNFRAPVIMAILAAAPYGDTSKAVIEMAGSPIHVNTLRYWVRKGRQDASEGKKTSYRIFAHQWDLLYRGDVGRGDLEAARLREISEAFDAMGLEVPEAITPPRMVSIDLVKCFCECGKRRPAGAKACPDCKDKDRVARQVMPTTRRTKKEL